MITAVLPGPSSASLPNPVTVVAGTTVWTLRVESNFSTASNAPFTPADLSIPLAAGFGLWIHVKGFAIEPAGGNVFEFDARNVWKRTGGGASTRTGTDVGVQTSVANQFPAPPATRPSVKFNDPAGINVGMVLFTGKLVTPLNWHVVSELIVGN